MSGVIVLLISFFNRIFSAFSNNILILYRLKKNHFHPQHTLFLFELIQAAVLECLRARHHFRIIIGVNPRTKKPVEHILLQELKLLPHRRLVHPLMKPICQFPHTDIDRYLPFLLQGKYCIIKRFRFTERQPEVINWIPSIGYHRYSHFSHANPCFSLLDKQFQNTQKPIVFIGCSSVVKHPVQTAGSQYGWRRYNHIFLLSVFQKQMYSFYW